MTTTNRADGRANDELRRIEFQPGFTTNPNGSVLVRFGSTMVLCTCMIEEGIPRFRPDESGWMTAEYAMSPGSTHDRMRRERRGAKGRTREIERMIGRSLRACITLPALGDHTAHVDCEVLQADGGTRTASVTGGFVALALACHDLLESGAIKESPLKGSVAAVSAGIIDGEARLDLPYEEDSRADVDLNLVLFKTNEMVEVQATGEDGTMSDEELSTLISLGRTGIRELRSMQRDTIGHEEWSQLGLEEVE
jgi:ribonuclease PH